jgi:hypothetical protein
MDGSILRMVCGAAVVVLGALIFMRRRSKTE